MVKPEGVVRVLVNGQTIVEHGELRPAKPGRVLRIGNAA
jgi:N-acyl-D-aspartate/D-glutamate deacylase